MRRLALGLGFVLGASSLAILGFAIYHAEELPDWGVPGLAALVAMAANVMFMAAFRLKRRFHPRVVGATDVDAKRSRFAPRRR
jgi:drug/metabolite transporter (DMT)-like permease